MPSNIHPSILQGYFFGLFYVLLVAIFIPSTNDPILLPRLLLTTVFLFLFFLSQVIGRNSDRIELNIPQISTPISWSYFLFVLMSFLSLFNAVNVLEGVFEIAKLIMLGLTFLCLTSFFSNDSKAILQVIKALSIGFILMFIFEAYQIVEMFETLWDTQPLQTSLSHLKGTMGSKNLLASASLLVLPLILYGATQVKRVWLFILIPVLIGLLFNVILFQVRTVWIATFVASLISIIAVFFIRPIKLVSQQYHFYTRKVLLIITVVISVLLSSIWFAALKFDKASLSEFRTSNELKVDLFENQSALSHIARSSTVRLELWQSSMEMLDEHHLLGIGAGNWKLNLPKHGLQRLQHRANLGTIHYQRPHNDFVWILSETGYLGLLFYSIMLLFVAYYIFQLLRYGINPQDRNIGIVLLFSLTAYLIISFFSFPKERVFHSIIFMTYLAWAQAAISRNTNAIPVSLVGIRKKFIVTTALLLSGSFIVLNWTRTTSDIHVKRVIELHSKKKWNEVLTELDHVNSKWYPLDPVSTPVQWYSGTAKYHLYGAARAKADFMIAYKAHPYHLPTLISLAGCYELSDNSTKAIELYKEAIAVSPGFFESYLNLSIVYYNLGRISDAYRTLRACKYDSANSKLSKAVNVILAAYLSQLSEHSLSHETKKTISRILGNPKQIEILHNQATGNLTPLEKFIQKSPSK